MINSISSGGVSAMMQSMSQSRTGPDTTKMAEELLSYADTDNDGTISESEFNSLFDSSDSADQETLKGLFQQMDSSEDGALSSTEISEALQSLQQQFREISMNNGMPPPPPPQANAEELISSADVDGDSLLDFSEFSTALQTGDANDSSILQQMFSEADADGDGKVSQQELQAAMESHRPPGSEMDSAAVTDDSAEQISRMVEALLDAYTIDNGDETISLMSNVA